MATFDLHSHEIKYPNGWIRLKDGRAKYEGQAEHYNCPAFGNCVLVGDPNKLLIILEPNGDYKVIEHVVSENPKRDEIKAKVHYAYNPADTSVTLFTPTFDELRAFKAGRF